MLGLGQPLQADANVQIKKISDYSSARGAAWDQCPRARGGLLTGRIQHRSLSPERSSRTQKQEMH